MAEAAAVGPGAVQPSANLQASLQRAARYASEQGHGAITIEHLLLALTEDPDALVVLATSGVELGRLRHDLADLLARMAVAEPARAGQITAANDLRKVFDYATAAAAQSQRGALDGAMLLAAIIGDGRSPGAEFLRGQGVTAEAILRSLDLIARSVARRSGNVPKDGPREAPREGARGGGTMAAKGGATPVAAAAPAAAMADPAASGVVVGAPATGTTPSRDGVPSESPSVPSAASRQPARPDAGAAVSGRQPPAGGDHSGLARLPGIMAGPPTAARNRSGGERELARLDDRPGRPGDVGTTGSLSGTTGRPPVGGSTQEAGPRAADPFGGVDVGAASHSGPVGGPARDVAAAAPPAPIEEFDGRPPASLSTQTRRPEQAPHGQRMSTVRPPEGVVRPPEGGARAGGGFAHRPPDGSAPMPHPQPRPRAQVPENAGAAGSPQAPRRSMPAAYPGEQGADFVVAGRGEHPGNGPQRSAASPASPAAPPTRGMQPEALEPVPRSASVPRSAPVRPPASPAPSPSSARTAPATAPVGRAASVRGEQPGADEFQAGLLVENVPRRMRVGVQAKVEARIAREDLAGLVDGLRGSGETHRHEVFVTRVMAVRLRAPDGGFEIESTSPEMQWVEGGPASRLVDEHASWRWSVTPTARGWRPLVLVITGLAVGPDGLAAERRVPDQEIEVQVRVNYIAEARRIGGWLVVAVLGGVLGAFGERLVALFGCCG